MRFSNRRMVPSAGLPRYASASDELTFSVIAAIFCLAACDVINQQLGFKVATPPANKQQEAILTPEAPSIAFPLPKPLVTAEPQVKVNICVRISRHKM